MPAKYFPVDTNGTLKTSLQSYYKMDDTNDFYGTNHGTLTGCSYVAGKSGNCLYAPGNNKTDKMTITNTGAFAADRLQPFSMSCWYKTLGVTWESAKLLTKLSAGITFPIKGYRWTHNYGDGKFRATLQTGYTGYYAEILTYSALTDTTSWHHLVWTWAGNGLASGMKIYVDGSAWAAQIIGDGLSANFNANASPIFCNDPAAFSTANFNGYIDEVGIWMKELSAQEVADLYNGGNGNFLMPIRPFPFPRLY